MIRISHLTPEFVEFIPDRLEAGILYVSRRYHTANHLCCCGCSLEVVTPLNPAKWRLVEQNGRVSLHPSVGNWSFPCRSHYWIKDNGIVWAGEMSQAAIASVKRRDRTDAELLARTGYGWRKTFSRRVASAWHRARSFIGHIVRPGK